MNILGENEAVGGDVLVVDDTPVNLKLLADILAGAGYRVRQATSGPLALRSAQAKPPGLILLDVKMPEMDGYEVCRRLKLDESTRSVPVIFVTVLSDVHERVRGFEVGGVDHICKPFQQEEVLARVKAHLTLAGLRRDVEARNVELQAANDQLAAEARERKRAEEALLQVQAELEMRVQRRTAELAKWERSFRTVAEFTYDWEYWVTQDGRVSYMTPSCKRITGYGREDFEADPALLDRIVHPEDRQRWLAHRGHCNTGDEELTFRIIRADGQVRWIGHLCQIVYGDDGENQGIRGSNRDITGRMQAEEELRRTHEQLRLAQRAAGAGTWDWNIITGQIDWSLELFDLFGLDSRTAVASFETWRSILHADDRQSASDGVDRAFRDDVPLFNEYRIVRPDGQVRWISAIGRTFHDEAGQPLRMAGICIDITERKSAEAHNAELTEQLRRSQKMQAVGQLAGGISHNFNNLLMAISGNAEVLADVLAGMPVSDGLATCLHHVGQLRQAVEMGTTLTKRLLAFCREQPLRMTVFDPNLAIGAMADMLRSTLGPGIRLLMEPGDRVGCLHSDRGQFEETILNLAINARDAMPAGGTFRINTSGILLHEAEARARGLKSGPHIRISLADTGRGMDDETRHRLFEPFFTTKPLGQGAGLGLATVYGFVKQTGGFIDADSVTDKGTTITLLLPASTRTIESVERVVAAPGSGPGGETVLICEDEPLIRQLIGRYLAANGYQVVEVEDAERALEVAACRDKPFDVLVTDVLLTGLSGLELALQLKEPYPALRCVLISGHPDCVPADLAGLGTGWTFLSKPFQLPRLLDSIQGLLRPDH